MRDIIDRPSLRSAWATVAIWLFVYGLIKFFSVDGLDLDSAEQVYFAQSWQLGYGTRQPPLYTWLLLWLKPAWVSWAATLEVARYVCLVAWLAGVQALARACGASGSVQARVVLAHLGVMLAMWRVHDSLTHTVLAATLTIWASAVLVKALSRPSWWPAVGVLAALACLAKLNAAVWCASALLAAWVVILVQWPRGHHRDGNHGMARPPSAQTHLVWMAVALAAFILIIAPYARWWRAQPSGSVALAHRIVVPEADLPFWQPMVHVVLGSLEYLLMTPLLLTLATWRLRARRVTAAQNGAGEHWLTWQTLIGMASLLAMLTAMKASHFTPRWLWPVIPGITVWMCVVAFRRVDGLASASRWRAGIGSMVWLVALASVGLAGMRLRAPEINAQRCSNCWTDRPAQAMSVSLHRQHGDGPLRIITGDDHLAGVLAQVNASDRTWTADSPDLPPPLDFARLGAPCVAAWVSMDGPHPMPQALLQLVGEDNARRPVTQASWPMRWAPKRHIWLQSTSLPATICDKAQP